MGPGRGVIGAGKPIDYLMLAPDVAEPTPERDVARVQLAVVAPDGGHPAPGSLDDRPGFVRFCVGGAPPSLRPPGSSAGRAFFALGCV